MKNQSLRIFLYIPFSIYANQSINNNLNTITFQFYVFKQAMPTITPKINVQKTQFNPGSFNEYKLCTFLQRRDQVRTKKRSNVQNAHAGFRLCICAHRTQSAIYEHSQLQLQPNRTPTDIGYFDYIYILYIYKMTGCMALYMAGGCQYHGTQIHVDTQVGFV